MASFHEPDSTQSIRIITIIPINTYLFTCLLTYLLTSLLSYIRYGAKSFLRK